MKHKGFTLVELLAVIVILAVIALIAVPNIMKIIEKARKDSEIESIRGIIREYKLKLTRNEYTVDKTVDLSSMDISKDIFNEGTISYNSKTKQVYINGKLAKDGRYISGEEADIGKSILIDSKETLTNLILNNNEIAQNEVDFSQKGTIPEFHSLEDDFGISYYFRGEVDNNWVKFGKEEKNGVEKDIWWRIIRINGDGSVRMIYTGTKAPDETEQAIMTGSTTEIGKSSFNDPRDSGEYIGYMYSLAEEKGFKNNSLIKNVIDNWYVQNFKADKSKIHDAIYCNDRGFIENDWIPVGAPSATKNSDVYLRLRMDNNPQFICNDKLDAFTVNKSNKGNGALTYPVGLITADELTIAGGYRTEGNSQYYLYTNRGYWTMSPSRVFTTGASGFNAGAAGDVNSDGLHLSYNIRPVITLKVYVAATGNGKYNNPYIIK